MGGLSRAASIWRSVRDGASGAATIVKSRLDVTFSRAPDVVPQGHANIVYGQAAPKENFEPGSCASHFNDFTYVFSSEACLDALTAVTEEAAIIEDPLLRSCNRFIDFAEHQTEIQLSAAGCEMMPLAMVHNDSASVATNSSGWSWILPDRGGCAA